MSLINAKNESKHEDSDVTNNGGLVVGTARGSTPKQAVGEKSTKNPDKNGGHNRAVKQSTYVGGWDDGSPTPA